MKARAILQTLIEEVKNPDISNATAAIRASMDAEALFKEESGAIQKPSAEKKIPRTRGPGKTRSKRLEEVGARDS